MHDINLLLLMSRASHHQKQFVTIKKVTACREWKPWIQRVLRWNDWL